MNIEQREQELERVKLGLMLCIGVCGTLTFFAVTGPGEGMSLAWSWYLLWLIFQIAVTPVGFVLFVSRDWRQLPLSQRLNTAFGYLAVAWVLFFAFIVKTNHDMASAYGGLPTLVFYGLVGSAGLALIWSYWLLRRAHDNSPEEMFP